MILTNLDTITRRYLLENGLPIHWYVEVMTHNATCLRELSFDALKTINAVRRPVDSTGSFYFPDDYQDDLAVCIPVADTIVNLPKQDNLNPIRLNDPTTGDFAPYSTVSQNSDGSQDFLAFPGIWNWYWNVNNYGEPTGRLFGASGGTQQGYKVIKEQRRIQLTDNFADSNVVLLYLSDGQSSDSATQVEVKAQATIQAFCSWKRSPNRDNKDSAEGRNYYNERRKLVARLDDLTKTDILNIFRNAYTGAIKA